MKKNILKITSFLLIFTLTLVSTFQILDFKYLDSTFKLDAFYELEDNTVDVLVLGSSHAYQAINTAVLWREYGYAAFNLCGAAQPIWNTYYYLEEALKTQTPKLIILDVYTLHYTTDYSETSFAIKNTYGLKWSDTKKKAIEASFDTETSGSQYYIELLQYHSRYSDINKTDFYPYQANEELYKNHKGFYCYFRSEAISEPDLSEVTYNNKMTYKNETYYRMILELAKSKNIPVIVTAIPFAAEPYHQGYFNEAKKIAVEQYNFPFYNFLTDHKEELNLDYSTDFADNQHMNHLGNTKLTRFFGDLIKEKYDVSDNRNNNKYDSWEADAKVYYNQLENHTNAQITSIANYIPVIKTNRYTSIITLSCPDFESLSERCKTQINFLMTNIDKDFNGTEGIWITEGEEITCSVMTPEDGFSKAVALGKTDGALIKSQAVVNADGTKKIINNIYFNKQKVSLTDYGLNILVYDNFTQSLVDVVCVDFHSEEFKR